MEDSLELDPGLLRRYDQLGPRYTSYPTAPHFGRGFGEPEYRASAERSNAAPIPADLSLYVHVPFCFNPCFYCGCTRIITRDRARGAPYVARVLEEAALVSPLFDEDREVVQLHLGGGTPNFLDGGALAMLVEGLAARFRFSGSPHRDFSIEIDPRGVEPGEIARLAELGFNRASLGVQDFDPAVQRAVNRLQGVEQTLAVIADCRANGMRSVNVDLIYGLPKQTTRGFERTLDVLTDARPDRFAIYGYAHLPEIFKPQRKIAPAELPDAAQRLELLRLAVRMLGNRGYRFIGMDHFALPGDDLATAQAAGRLHRNFMGYTTHDGCDLVGLGVSAISHFGDAYSQNFRELPAWELAVSEGRLPVWRGLALAADDVLRADVIEGLMCQGEIDVARIEHDYGIDFASYFGDALEKLGRLAADGLVAVGGARIRVTSSGRLLLRVIAMCFDRYIAAAQAARYSQVV